MSSFTEPISPELALVSPELAAAARATLPDRPWEVFFVPTPEVVQLRPPVIAQPAAAAPSAEVVEPRRPSRRRPRVPVGLMLLVAFVGLVAAGSVLPARDAPTLGPPPARANGLSVPEGQHATPQGPQAPSLPARSTSNTATVPAHVPKRSTSPTTTTAATTTPVPHADPAPRPTKVKAIQPLARPQGGYLLAGGLGVLRVGAGARSIAEIRTNVGCGWAVVTKRIRIAPDGRFSARRSVAGHGRSTISVSGIFARAGTVRGTIRATKGRCASGPVVFTGRLS